VHPCHDRLGDRLHGEHELGARIEQLADRRQIGAREIPEVVAGGEDGAICREDHTAGVAVAGGAEGRREVTQQPERQRVAPLGPVHRDGREVPFGLHDHGVGADRHHPRNGSSPAGG
jgi:hypothetical protein